MSLLGDIVARLKAQCPVLANRVEIARSINNPDPTGLPEAWVYRWMSVATGPSTTFSAVRQSNYRQIGILLAAKIEDEADNVDHYEAARDEVMAALLGYTVGSGDLPLEFVKDEFIAIEDGYTLSRLTFQFVEHIRSA